MVGMGTPRHGFLRPPSLEELHDDSADENDDEHLEADRDQGNGNFGDETNDPDADENEDTENNPAEDVGDVHGG